MWQQLWGWISEPVNQKLFLIVLGGIIVGWSAGRFSLIRKKRKEQALPAQGDKAFLKGIRYLLSNDHDQAIEALTKSVQINSETIETYLALGNLYRSKGDIDRAIRIRQSIILRPHIDEQIKLRALTDLGLDYRKGGFMNRALDSLSEVLKKQPANLEALEAIEEIYEELQDWENAFSTRQKVARLVKGDHKHILAHYQVERGKSFLKDGSHQEARACFQKAISLDPGCIDAYLHLGDLHFGMQKYKKAIASWKKVVLISPRFTFLAYRRLEGAYARMKNLKPIEDFLRDCVKKYSDAFTHMALARYLLNEKDPEGALRELDSALKLKPSFWEARRLKGEILLAYAMKEDALTAYRDLIAHLDVPYLMFQCTHCGYVPHDLQWQCPQCRKWDTITLMDADTVDTRPSESGIPYTHSQPKRLAEEGL